MIGLCLLKHSFLHAIWLVSKALKEPREMPLWRACVSYQNKSVLQYTQPYHINIRSNELVLL